MHREPDKAAAGARHGQIGRERCARVPASHHHRLQTRRALSGCGLGQAGHVARARRGRPGRHGHDAIEPFRPGDRVALQIPMPAADMGQALRLIEGRLALLERGFGGIAFGDVADNPERLPAAADAHRRGRKFERKFVPVPMHGREQAGPSDNSPQTGIRELCISALNLRAIALRHEQIVDFVRRQSPRRCTRRCARRNCSSK